MTVKKRVQDKSTDLPEDRTIDDIGYRRDVVPNIQEGMDDFTAGRHFSH